MKKIFFISFTLPLLSYNVQEGDYINWQSSRKLTWDDFKAAPLKLGNTAALTTTHLGFSYRVVNGDVSYDIDCRFQKSRSWGLVKNDWILKHEQGHFDIAEIFARKLKKGISEYTFNKNSFQKDLDAIYKSVTDAKDNFQQQYDDETDYSRNKEKQEAWLKKIEGELERHDAWSVY